MRNDEQWPDPLRKELYALVAGQTLHQMTLETLETEQKFKEAAAMYLEDLKNQTSCEKLPGGGHQFDPGVEITSMQSLSFVLPASFDPHSAATQFGSRGSRCFSGPRSTCKRIRNRRSTMRIWKKQ